MLNNPVSIAAMRSDGEWLRTTKHATRDVIKAGELLESAADEIEQLREQHHSLFEALKLALACEPADWSIWREEAQAAVDKVVASMTVEDGAEPKVSKP